MIAMNSKYFSPRNDDTGNVDAGDASASLYNLNEDNIDQSANQQRTGLTPGEDVEGLRAAKHGNPDASIDGDAEDITGKDSGTRNRADETSV